MSLVQRICSAAAITCCLMHSLACQTAVAAEAKQVMLLHSFGRDFKPWSEYAKSIREELNRQSLWPLDITEHSLVTARFGDEDPEVPFVEYLRAIFVKRPLDLPQVCPELIHLRADTKNDLSHFSRHLI